MKQISDRVRTFFERYEKGTNSTDPDLVALQYCDTFLFGGPGGVQAVKKEDFLQTFPKREGFFKAIGLTASRIKSLQETQLDQNYVMVKVAWSMKFEKPPGSSVDVDLKTTYVLFQQESSYQIVFQLDHQDFMKRVQDLGLLP